MNKKVWFILDFENQNIPYYGAVASPHHPDNYIVAVGYAIDTQPVVGHYFHCDEEAKAHKWIDELKDCKYLVAHNLTFEIHWLLRTYPEQFYDFIRNGGKVFCTQYAEFLLSHQLELYPNLDDTAPKYGGTNKINEVSILWQRGVLTADIDQALLMEYLADQNHGDVANTRRICFGQVSKLREQGMFEMFMARMDGLLFDAIATYNGLHVDMEVAQRNQAEQEAKILELKQTVLSYIPSDVPPELDYSFTSTYHRSALLFGGGIKYKKKVSYDPVKYEQIEAYEWVDSGGVHHYVPVADADLVNGEFTKFKAGVNKGLPKVFKVDSDVEKLKWGEGVYTFKGLIDLNTLPPNVSRDFIGKHAEYKSKLELCDGTPIYKTGGEVLELLSVYAPVTAPLRDLAKLIKDTGTYYLQVDPKTGEQSGMLQFVEPSGIIHHQLNSCATITARKSSSKPNLQNVPRDGTSKVKEMFTSRFGSQGRIVEVDYSALEVVALAAISGDKNLLRMLTDNIDMHCYRLAAKLKEDYDSVVQKCKDDSNVDHKLYKEMRIQIKPRAFAHQYGASAEGISYSTGCSLAEAVEFKEIEFKLFPQSNAFPSEIVRPMVEASGLTAKAEKEQNPVTGAWEMYRRGTFIANSGTRYSFRQHTQWKDGRKVVDYKDTQIANYWCQGEASFIVQAATGDVIRRLILDGFANNEVLPINTVHDAIYLDCANEALAIAYGKIVQQIMEATPARLAECIPALKEWNYHTTPFPAAAEMGSDMMNKTHIH